ncbi:MAG: hypothetical protein FJW63_09815 [Actinobacteria bacterium]|nr:hypothetical protein [Actinomycetota bacterium]
MSEKIEEGRKDKRYEILELLARLSNYKGLLYEIDEIKDGRIISIKNIRIEKIELKDSPLQ